MGKLAVVRIRSGINARGDVKKTLNLLRLTRVNHCVVVDDDPSTLGMIKKAKDYITWGEVDPKTLEYLLRKRGRLSGNRPLTDDFIRSKTEFSGIDGLAAALCAGEIRFEDVPGLKKVFRLHPPRKGYKSTKRPVGDLGDLGYRGRRINELIMRMA